MGQATERMIEFAKAIAKELDIDEPDFNHFEETSEFIGEYKDEFYDSLRRAK